MTRRLASLLFVGRRVAEAALVFSLAVLFVFVVTRLMPGDPVGMMTEGQGGDPDFARRLRTAGGMDLPLWRQFAGYVAGLLQGDLGLSWRYGDTPVATLILEAAPVTLLLATLTMIVAVPAGIAAGIASAHRPGTWLDGAVTFGSVLALATPPVVLATWLMLMVSTFWDLPAADGLAGAAGLVAPVAVLAPAPAGVIARTTRAQVLDVLGRDYVRCARAKGLTELAVLLRHALPNALAAVATVAGTLAGAILASTAVVETVFNLPGLGRLAIFSVLARDYPLAGAIILAFVLAQVAISLMVDLLIVTIDPRSRDTRDTRDGP